MAHWRAQARPSLAPIAIRCDCRAGRSILFSRSRSLATFVSPPWPRERCDVLQAPLRDYAGDCFGGKLPLARFSDVPSRCSHTPTWVARIAAIPRAAVRVPELQLCVAPREWPGQMRRLVAYRRPSGGGAGDEGPVEREAATTSAYVVILQEKTRHSPGTAFRRHQKKSLRLDNLQRH